MQVEHHDSELRRERIMNQPQYWPTGSQIVYREVWRGKVWTARPVTVVQDTPDLIALYLCSNTRWKVPDGNRGSFQDLLAAGDWQLADTTWMWGDTLLLIHPSEAHAVHVMWGHENGKFVGWYINLQEPLRRTAIGFDFMDQDLDIVVKPDLSGWVWKDEEWFQRRQEIGLLSNCQAREIRAEGERVIERVRAKASPFGDGWEDWFPSPKWPVPSLPDGWDEV
jgi:hypothetical protein